MLKDRLLESFDTYPDFPKKGILFQDLLTVLRDPPLFHELTNEMSRLDLVVNSDAIVAIDARGFFFGTAIALSAKKPLIPIRKPGKLPGELITRSYDLEYGSNSLCLQKKAIKDYKTFCIIDDLFATGGTASCVEQLLLIENKIVQGIAVVVELAGLKGRDLINCELNSQLLIQ